MKQPNTEVPPIELTEENVAIHLKLLKRLRYCDMIVPTSKQSWSLFGYNGHRLSLGAAFAVLYTVMVYANSGFFAPAAVDYELTDVEFCIVLCTDLFILMNMSNMFVLLYHLPEVTSLLDMTRVDFLTSAACRRNRGTVLRDCRTKVIWFSNMYSSFCALAIFQWIMFASVSYFFSNVVDESRAAGKRVPSVMDMPFPVDIRTYNKYYLVFFIAEATTSTFELYCLLMIDLYIMSYGWIISAHYEVLARAFRNFGHDGSRKHGSPVKCNAGSDNDDRDNNDYEELKSILTDQLKLVSKLKSFNAVARPIICTVVSISSGVVVLLTFVFIMICSVPDSFSIPYLVKVTNADLFFGLQLYVYCNLIDNLNAKKGAINLAIYSSDWTRMDIKVKKLLLLTMRLNDANPLLIKATPIKLINLELFVSVLKTCYSIISVMVNSLSK